MIEVPLPRPRPISLLQDETFLAVRRRIDAWIHPHEKPGTQSGGSSGETPSDGDIDIDEEPPLNMVRLVPLEKKSP
jgi:hypothetical protein